MNFLKTINNAKYNEIASFSFEMANNLLESDDCALKDIPGEIFLNILPFLTLTDLTSFRFVCKKWKNIENKSSSIIFCLIEMKGDEALRQLSKSYELYVRPQ